MSSKQLQPQCTHTQGQDTQICPQPLHPYCKLTPRLAIATARVGHGYTKGCSKQRLTHSLQPNMKYRQMVDISEVRTKTPTRLPYNPQPHTDANLSKSAMCVQQIKERNAERGATLWPHFGCECSIHMHQQYNTHSRHPHSTLVLPLPFHFPPSPTRSISHAVATHSQCSNIVLLTLSHTLKTPKPWVHSHNLP